MKYFLMSLMGVGIGIDTIVTTAMFFGVSELFVGLLYGFEFGEKKKLFVLVPILMLSSIILTCTLFATYEYGISQGW